MGSSIWLFLWCLQAQTKPNGLVLGGMPLTYAEISKRSRFPERRVRRWLDRLRTGGYIRVEYRNFMMMCLWVLKPQKFNYKQIPLPLTENGQPGCPKTVNGSPQNGQPKQSGSMKRIESETPRDTPARSIPQLSEQEQKRRIEAKAYREQKELEARKEILVGTGPSSSTTAFHEQLAKLAKAKSA